MKHHPECIHQSGAVPPQVPCPCPEWREAERRLAEARRVLGLLDTRVEILRRPGDPSLAAYFEGRDAGELAGTQQAADALRRALGDDDA